MDHEIHGVTKSWTRLSDFPFHFRHRVRQKCHAQEVSYSPKGLPSFWPMAVPEGQRDQRSIKKWSLLSYDAQKNLIFLEHVHNHASVVCTKLRRWVERITITGLQRNVVTCSEFTQWVRRLGSFVAPLAASYPHAHLSSRVPPPWGTTSPRPLFCFPWPSYVSFPGLPWLSEAESSFLPSSPPAPILSSPLAAKPLPSHRVLSERLSELKTRLGKVHSSSNQKCALFDLLVTWIFLFPQEALPFSSLSYAEGSILKTDNLYQATWHRKLLC